MLAFLSPALAYYGNKTKFLRMQNPHRLLTAKNIHTFKTCTLKNITLNYTKNTTVGIPTAAIILITITTILLSGITRCH